MNTATLEALIGAGVMAGGLALLTAAYAGHNAAAPGYDLVARFNRVDGVGLGSPVLLAGVRVGEVTAQKLDDHFRAVLTLHVAPDVKLPTDSAALVETDGILGSKFVSLDPGGAETNMKPGAEFPVTQDSISVTDILQLIIDQGAHPTAAPPAPAGH